MSRMEELPELVESSSSKALPEEAAKDEPFSEVRRKRKHKDMDTSEPAEAEAVKRPSFPPANVSTSLVSSSSVAKEYKPLVVWGSIELLVLRPQVFEAENVYTFTGWTSRVS